MAQLIQIKSRMKSVTSTLKITKAMKMIAAARLVKAREEAGRVAPVIKYVSQVVGKLREFDITIYSDLAKENESEKVLYVCVTSDRGFCGGFNTKITNYLSEEISKLDMDKDNIVISSIGSKGADTFEKSANFQKVPKEIENIWEDNLYDQSSLIYEFLEEKFLAGEYKEIHLVFAEFKSVLTQIPKSIKLFPVDLGEEEVAKETDKYGDVHIYGRTNYLMIPSEEKVVKKVLPIYTTSKIFGALVETRAGEYGARMTAMDGATRNGEKLINKLRIQYQRARQEIITKELAELIGGVECLRRDQE